MQGREGGMKKARVPNGIRALDGALGLQALAKGGELALLLELVGV